MAHNPATESTVAQGGQLLTNSETGIAGGALCASCLSHTRVYTTVVHTPLSHPGIHHCCAHLSHTRVYTTVVHTFHTRVYTTVRYLSIHPGIHHC